MTGSAKQSIGTSLRGMDCFVASLLAMTMIVEPDIEGRDRRGRKKPKRTALLRAAQRPRPQARSLQRHHRAAPDRLDFVARRQGQYQPCALQLLQRLLLSPADHRLF